MSFASLGCDPASPEHSRLFESVGQEVEGSDPHLSTIEAISHPLHSRLSPHLLVDDPILVPWSMSVTVQYIDRVYDETGYEGDHITRFSPFVRVDLVKMSFNDEQELEETFITGGWTDERGHIDLGWRAALPQDQSNLHKDSDEEQWRVYILSELETPAGHRAEVSSQSGSLYRLLAEVNRDQFRWTPKPRRWSSHGALVGPSLTLVTPEEGRLSGALNILSMIAEGYEVISNYSDIIGPPLTITWTLDEPVSCGSCYVGNKILLGGQVEDPDHYDDHIILHEMGHFFTDRWSLDNSPGGPHRGRAVTPTLAYGEGVAYFWSALVLDDPLIVDWMFPEPWVVDLERSLFNGEPMTWGLEREVMSDQPQGYLSATHHEELVSSLMWALYSALDLSSITDSQDDDLVDLGVVASEAVGVMMKVLLETLPSKMRAGFDSGAEGVDLADWLDSFHCMLIPGLEEEPTVSIEETERLANDREYPWRWSYNRDEVCSGKGGEDLLVVTARRLNSGTYEGTYEPTLSLQSRSLNNGMRLRQSVKGEHRWEAWIGEPPKMDYLGGGICQSLPCTLSSLVLSESEESPVIFTLSTEGSPTVSHNQGVHRQTSWRSPMYKQRRAERAERSMYGGRSVISETAQGSTRTDHSQRD